MENKGLVLVESLFMSYAACMNPSQPNSLNPFQTLQLNASVLFRQIQDRNDSQMVCGSGCSKCCHAEFSIFLGEALLIYRWFQTLSEEQKNKAFADWREKPHEKACQFLRNHQCTIYESRPIICRTQGAPLSFSAEKKGEITKTVDCCPLNFDAGKSVPKTQKDWFDLDRLASLQVIAENYVLKNFEIPAELKAICDENERIPLRSLHLLLTQNASRESKA